MNIISHLNHFMRLGRKMRLQLISVRVGYWSLAESAHVHGRDIRGGGGRWDVPPPHQLDCQLSLGARTLATRVR